MTPEALAAEFLASHRGDRAGAVHALSARAMTAWSESRIARRKERARLRAGAAVLVAAALVVDPSAADTSWAIGKLRELLATDA